MLSPTLIDPEWDEYAAAWFHRWVKRFLHDPDERHPLLNDVREDADLIEAVTEALLARRAELVRWIDDKSLVPDHFNGRWVIDWQAVRDALWDLLPACRAGLEAERFPSLDAWLSALHRGEVSPGPEEPWAGWLVQRGRAAWIKARQHRRRPCRVCGRAFRPVDHRQGGPQQRRGNATRCPDCRREPQRRVARKDGRK